MEEDGTTTGCLTRCFCCLVGWGIDGLSARVLVCCLVTIEEALDCANDAVDVERLDGVLDEEELEEGRGGGRAQAPSASQRPARGGRR